MRTLILLGLCALVALPQPLRADAFSDGARAAIAGDYATAFGHWLPLAEGGDADAQYNLGNLYDRGLGRAEDDAAAAADSTAILVAVVVSAVAVDVSVCVVDADIVVVAAVAVVALLLLPLLL